MVYHVDVAQKPNKTAPTGISVDSFLEGISNGRVVEQSRDLIDLMEAITGHPATMWGPSIIGFDSYHYEYASGRTGDAAALSFSPRSTKFSVYLMDGTAKHEAALKALGPHSTGKACLYIKSLDQVDHEVLRNILIESYRSTQAFDVSTRDHD